MGVVSAHRATFEETYDDHMVRLLTVPGVRRAFRGWLSSGGVVVGGEQLDLRATGTADHLALYEIERPEVLLSPEWAVAVDEGRWAQQVRPFTKDRDHRLMEVAGSHVSAQG